MASLSIYSDTARGVYNPSTVVNAYVLTPGVVDTVTVPTGMRVVSFATTGNFFANFNGATAAVPTVDITNGTASTLNPTVRRVVPGQTISIIAPANCIVTASFYEQE